MSESARESRPQFGFLSAVGLFFLAVLAVLVALYFYNADIRQAGDGAIDHARAYKRTIVADYSRFYECMRGGIPASPQPVKAEGASGSRGPASVPVVVYPPYADYPTYPAYHDGATGARRDATDAAVPPSLPGAYGTMGTTSRPPESASAEAGGPPGIPAPPSAREGQAGFAMQPGPMMSGGPGMPQGPSMQGEHQVGPAMQTGPSMEPGPIMEGVPTMQAGPMMPPGPTMQPESAMQSYRGTQSGPEMYSRPVPQGYPPSSAAWQGPGMPPSGMPPSGMPPSGMPPSGMAAPMPYGQGQFMGQPPQGQGTPPPAGPNYGMPSGGPGRYGPQGNPPPTPWTRYGYGMAASPSGAEGGAPAVIPATPTMPITSMMPPPGDAAPVLPGDAGQVDPQIAAARQAAANQQHQEAIRIYRAYISRNANDPSAFGELGNVLLSAGRPQEAAQAYYEASSRLIDVGQPGTVYLLLPHIEQHDPLLGAVLMRRLASLPRSIY